jgi:hypothetical protein
VWLKSPIVVVGLGELGQVMANGFLRIGHPVYPINRESFFADVNALALDPLLVVVAVGEKDLDGVLMTLPDALKDRVVLLQNNLLESDWVRHGIRNPTILVVWLDKKPGRPAVAVLPNKVFGPYGDQVAQALNAIEIDTHARPIHERDRALVAKNLYIHTINIAGLRVGGTVGELWNLHRLFAENIAREILLIQNCRLGQTLDMNDLMGDMLEGFSGDWNHLCTGRSAPSRLANALFFADHYQLAVPTIRAIAKELGVSGQGVGIDE